MSLLSKLFVLLILSFLGFYAYLLVEEGRELQVWEKAPSTLGLYSTGEVCVEEEEEEGTLTAGAATTSSSSTMPYEEAKSLGPMAHILNCGHCGKCSNRHDIAIYNATRQTLTEITTQCTKGGLFRGRNMSYVKECLQHESQLTEPCVDCWMLNVECNWKNCFKTCVKHKVAPFRWLPSYYQREHSSPMDPCIECDERMCGTIFVACAGANRRRVGVVSDIQRNFKLEICSSVDWDWVQPSNARIETPSTTTTTISEPIESSIGSNQNEQPKVEQPGDDTEL